ncbi:transforming protein RhoA [Nephila pilipes]|uniref:Transforming protein RhoA n=1 Tax=Nephila pilipes TaxID=299642 RepID=A0A8X6R7I2_NEPPI|nr:transforming protein RhoA [Nephila pilipes]
MALTRKRLGSKDSPIKFSTKLARVEKTPVSLSPKSPFHHHEDYVQILVVGHQQCGKSCLVLAFQNEVFPPVTHFLSKQYLADIELNGKTKKSMIWDLDASPQYLDARKEAYEEADVILLCFSIDGNVSLTQKTEVWIQEIRNYCPQTPVILVGLKNELRHRREQSGLITKEEANRLRETQSFVNYMEASAVIKDGVNEIFTAAVRVAIQNGLRSKVMWANRGFKIDFYA